MQTPTYDSGPYVLTLTDKHTMNGGDWVVISLIFIQLADGRCAGTVFEEKQLLTTAGLSINKEVTRPVKRLFYLLGLASFSSAYGSFNYYPHSYTVSVTRDSMVYYNLLQLNLTCT